MGFDGSRFLAALLGVLLAACVSSHDRIRVPHEESSSDRVVTLADGRTLGYAEYGDPAGRPVFYFTGGNSSRLEGRPFHAAALRAGVRLIVADRPGFGLSDFQPERTLLDWPNDVAELADALEVVRFAVFGLSGGGPHVAAVAVRMRSRVTAAAIVSGLAPPEMPNRYDGMWFPVRTVFWLNRWAPPLGRFALRRMNAFYADPDNLRTRMRDALPQPDIDLIDARPELIAEFSAAWTEAHRNGVDGDAWEWKLYLRPWGFELEDIDLPVSLWYGEHDRNVPVAMGRYLHGRLPHSDLHVVPDGGHLSTIHNHIDTILAELRVLP